MHQDKNSDNRMIEVTQAVRFIDGNMMELYKSMAAITKVIFLR